MKLNNFDDIFSKIKVMSCDTEILRDYFSFGFKIIGLKRKQLKVFESNLKFYGENRYLFFCRDDKDCKKFSSFYSEYLEKKTVQIFYNDKFDKAMLDILFNKVKNKKTQIIPNMRQIASLICRHGLNYFDLKKSILNKELSYNELENKSEPIQKFFMSMDGVTEDLLKNFSIIDAPTIGGNCFIDKNNNFRPSVSLKKLQVIFDGKSKKFDFSKYESWVDIKKDKQGKNFIDYSLFDLDSLEQYILMFCSNVFEVRFKLMQFNQIDVVKNYKIIFNNDNNYLVNYLFKKRGGYND